MLGILRKCSLIFRFYYFQEMKGFALLIWEIKRIGIVNLIKNDIIKMLMIYFIAIEYRKEKM